MGDVRQRRYLAALVGVVLAVAAVAACRPGGHDRPPGTGLPGTSVATTGTTGTTSPGTLPPWRTTTTVAVPQDCGAILRGGEPTTASSGQAVGCFRAAWDRGTPATLRIPGAQVEVLEVVGVHQLIRTVAPSGTRQLCTRIEGGPDEVRPADCGPVPPPRTETGALDCGVLRYATGWPTTPALRLPPCFLDAWTAGEPARLITRDQTDGQGGAILIVMYEILGPGRLRVTTDPTDTVQGGPVAVQACTGLEHDATRLRPTGCVPA